MKYLFALVFCALLSVGFGVYCTSEEECEDTECCVATYTAQALGTGWCTPRGRVGAACNLETDQLGEGYGKKYLTKCPCRDTLICTQTVTSGSLLQINNGQKCRRDS
ncbi:hypothetical protein JTE90_009897 [Oedothorax gibbosus]|uniref:Prokineticin domain-containing protein n=1 Tax=Oedothorax gibbosus TaxID=931172 RepID=A0AAV6UW57_9ARAC|nr:hypothetical protein JTE90_009897 [Oedothorax gibbosus]